MVAQYQIRTRPPPWGSDFQSAIIDGGEVQVAGPRYVCQCEAGLVCVVRRVPNTDHVVALDEDHAPGVPFGKEPRQLASIGGDLRADRRHIANGAWHGATGRCLSSHYSLPSAAALWQVTPD